MNSKKKSKDAKDAIAADRSCCREPIAIIGIGCRYPGASNPAELWQTLVDGKEKVGPYPGGRFADLDNLYEQARRKPGRILNDRGGFLEDIAGFDSQFFEISPRESMYLDPQHRLLLEVAWEALEDAGQVRESYVGSATGVYTGLWTNEYQSRLYESATEADFYSVTGCGHSAAPARLSFAFGLQGPSLAVDTACSSSLTAVHLACQALWAREIDMALAGGANVILGCEISERFTQAKMLSPDGRCKFGDASANGFVRGEGAGIVVLKRLSQAIADKDPIYALIRGSATNNDGRSNFLVAPSIDAQERMLRAAWKSADIDPKNILYIEMHGTGTRIGDRVEIKAVSGALAKSGVTRPCLLGSVKTNFGHTESAAGVAGLIKAALIAKHRFVAPSLNVTVPTPKVAWKSIPVHVATKSVDLSTEQEPILVGVSSFGLSGTNVHVVLEATKSVPAETSQGTGPYILPVSAKAPEALQAMLDAHLAAMRSAGQEYPIRDVCYTAGARRTHHEYRVAIVGEDRENLEKNLAAAAAKEDSTGVVFGRVNRGQNKIVFVAPGQGSQWLGMARELFERDPVFRQAFDQCDSAIVEETGWRLTDRVLGPDAEAYFSQIDVIQPALFAMSVALAAVWRSWGIEPDAVVGHSMGEVAAAHIAGILNLTDAVAVICRRSRLMKTLSSAGSMATVELPLHEVEALLQSRTGISIGASNGPGTTVISGDSKSIEALLKELEAKEIYCRQIKVDVASHSAQVDPILKKLFTELSDIRPLPARIPMLSTVTGEYASGSGGDMVMDAGYWVENLRRSVLFAPAIEKLSRDGYDTFIELSPHPILLPSTEASALVTNPRALAIASLRREQPARTTMLGELAALYAAGRKIAWKKLYPEEVRCVGLPQYRFQRKRYWPEPIDPARARIARHTGEAGPLLGHKFEFSLHPNMLLWETKLDIMAVPYLNDYRVLRSVVFSASGQIEMALSGAKAARPAQAFELRDVSFLNAAYIPDEGGKAFQLALIPDGDEAFRFEIRGHAEQAENTTKNQDHSWTLHSTGIVAPVEADSTASHVIPLAELKDRCRIHRDRDEQYARTGESGLHYGPAFQLVEEVWVGEGESLCRFRCDLKDGDGYVVHPALLDACFQAMPHLKPEQDAYRAEDTYLPVLIEKIRVYGTIPSEGDLFAQANFVSADPVKRTLRADLRMSDSQGNVLVDVIGMELMWVTRERLLGAPEPLYSLEWIEEKLHLNPQSKAEASVALLPEAASQNCVVFADSTGIAEAVKASLVSAGGRCTLVKPGSMFRKMAEAEFEINPGVREDLDRLFEEVAVDSGVPTAVVHLWTLDNASSNSYDAEGLIRAQALGSQHIPGVVQAITTANWQNPPRLWLVTAGAMSVGDGNDLPRIENAPMWGTGRTVAREHAELRTTLIDLSVAADPREARALALQICARGKEDGIALRGDTRYVARLTHFSAAAPATKMHVLADEEDYRVEISTAGILDTVELRARSPRLPRADEVALEVIESGLNFSDITKVMGLFPGLIPGEPIPLGNECAGRVIAVGPGATGFHIGDEVIAITPSVRTTGLMASSVSVPVELVLHKPTRLSFEEAATIAIVYLTAYYSLVEQARIRRGEWVLIHAGAGGVGLAAIEIAKWAGANIIATVGSEEKANYLRSLGITHVLNSRSLTFASGVMEITHGRGVDIVLNSLAGEFLSKGLEVVAPYGRFIELGKRDVYDDKRVGLKVFRNNVSFHVVDVAAALEDRRPYVAGMLREVMRHIESGEWRPLPVQSFSAAEPSVPFRFMAQARHIGKISLRMDRNVSVLPATDRPLFCANATYLLTGGLGGVALTVAEWMAKNGAGHIVLLSRRAPSPESAEAIGRMEKDGATVVAVRADITREAELAKVLDSIHATMPPLRGIMHTAAVVDDALIVDLSPERFLPVMAPKITGAWNLHQATLHEELDFFVLFSSIAAIHPQPGMGSYAAANAFLDSFAHYLRALGKPATSVNWGGWEQIGLARTAGTGRSIEGYMLDGMRTFSGKEALELLRRTLESNPIHVIAVPIDADKFAEFHGPNNIPSIFSGLVSQIRAKTTAQSNRSEILDQLTKAESAKQRHEILETYLQEVLGRVIKLATHKIDRERPLGSMGLDSLMGLEFVRRLSNALEIAVPATVVFNYPTIKLLTNHLLRRMQLETAEEAAGDIENLPNPNMSNGKDNALVGLSVDLSEEEALHALIGNGQRSS